MGRPRLLTVLAVLAMTLIVAGLAACSGVADERELLATVAPTATSVPVQVTPIITATATTTTTATATSTPTATIIVTATATSENALQSQEQPDRTARRDDGSLGVIFRVTVPLDTPPNSKILMTGDRPALGSGVEMKPGENDPLVYEAEVVFGHDGTLNYRFELSGGEAVSSPKRVKTDFDGQVVNDRVESWAASNQ